MKNFSKLAILPALAVMAFASCSNDEDYPGGHLSILDANGNPVETVAATSKTFSVDYSIESNTEWTLIVPEDAASWLTVKPANGVGNGTVKFTINANSESTSRTAIVKLDMEGAAYKEITVTQGGKVLNVEKEFINPVAVAGGDYNFYVDAVGDFSVEFTPSDGVTYKVQNVENSTEKKVVASFPENKNLTPVQYTAEFKVGTSAGDETESVSFEQYGTGSIYPELMDIEFRRDGSAVDVSPMHHEVMKFGGENLSVSYNGVFKRYVPTFTNGQGKSVPDSYYRIDYPAAGDLVSKIADGCSMESIVMMSEPYANEAQVKWFGSTQGGGMCFMINKGVPLDNTLVFLSKTIPGTWVFCFSGVQPKPYEYYHVVGVWDKANSQVRVYVDGKLRRTTKGCTSYESVSAGAEAFIIGGDPSGTKACTNAWPGDIVTARVYDRVLSDEEVAIIYNKQKWKPSPAPSIED